SGVSAGIDGHIQFTPKTIFNIDLTHHYYASKLPGSFGMERIGETFNRSYHISTASLGLSQEFAQGWHFSSQLSGQFTLQDISSIDLFSVTGTYGVRGFKYGGASGERGLVWRNELSMPKYTRFQISPYAFYDAGQFRYNSENAKTYGEDMHTVSSAGLGIKTSPTQNLSLDAFVARRFANANSDNLNGNKKRTSSPTTFWGRLTFSF
ncbi:TPA: two-partner secretion (TPS) system translocator Hmw1B, partial [Haemophilus influenzae]